MGEKPKKFSIWETRTPDGNTVAAGIRPGGDLALFFVNAKPDASIEEYRNIAIVKGDAGETATRFTLSPDAAIALLRLLLKLVPRDSAGGPVIPMFGEALGGGEHHMKDRNKP